MLYAEVLYKYPKKYLLSGSPRKEMGPHEKEKKYLTLVDLNQRPPEQIIVDIPTELQGQMGASLGY